MAIIFAILAALCVTASAQQFALDIVSEKLMESPNMEIKQMQMVLYKMLRESENPEEKTIIQSLTDMNRLENDCGVQSHEAFLRVENMRRYYALESPKPELYRIDGPIARLFDHHRINNISNCKKQWNDEALKGLASMDHDSRMKAENMVTDYLRYIHTIYDGVNPKTISDTSFEKQSAIALLRFIRNSPRTVGVPEWTQVGKYHDDPTSAEVAKKMMSDLVVKPCSVYDAAVGLPTRQINLIPHDSGIKTDVAVFFKLATNVIQTCQSITGISDKIAVKIGELLKKEVFVDRLDRSNPENWLWMYQD